MTNLGIRSLKLKKNIINFLRGKQDANMSDNNNIINEINNNNNEYP